MSDQAHDTKTRGRAAAVLAKGGVLLLTLLLMEACLQGVTRLPGELEIVRAVRRSTSYTSSQEELFWKRKFLDSYDQARARSGPGVHPMLRSYRPDPYLGWVARGGLPGPMSTNRLGFRSPQEYEPDAERYTVLIVGDSFTFGDGAADSDVWPTLLGERSPDLQVLNFGVSGYGLGQMYLMLERQIGTFQPDLVIVAFIDDDLRRSLLSFRAYQKPRFRIENGQLSLGENPVDTSIDRVAQEVRKEIKTQGVLAEIRLWGLIWNAVRLAADRRGSAELWQLNQKLLEAMIDTSRAHGAEVLLLYLPHGREIAEREYRGYGLDFFEAFLERRAVRSLNPRAAFFEQEGVSFSSGHYRRNAAELVAREVHREILRDLAAARPEAGDAVGTTARSGANG